ncbi:MAG: CDP-alcohol phosphatidyltransferase family protein [Candidatus Thermoplasmatota archaeon]|nr:CDP-alcohol phosphatidyltransferase family protein [Candidatus Thermoplasmatota archaeon]MBU1914121.1 CDP-alcohol phosphatidyltransferase family protein [Candidatus Thermoplasmatota archaeon]
MVLDSYRGEADKILSPAAKRLSTINPNYLSLSSLILAIAAALFYVMKWDQALLIAAVFVALSGIFDALDGKVARISSKASKRGDFVDHVIDRYSDAIILAAIAMSAICPVSFGLFAVIGVLLASYMGTQAQALGLSREYRGILGRADRIAVLIAVSLIMYLFQLVGSDVMNDLLGYTLMGWMMIYFGLAGNITALQRAWLIWKSLP